MRWPQRLLVVVVMMVSFEIRAEPARWWRSRRVAAQLHLTSVDCEEVERAYEQALPVQRQATLDAARALDGISRRLKDGFEEETLLALTSRLAAAQTAQQAVHRDVSRKARAACARRHAPPWLVARLID